MQNVFPVQINTSFTIEGEGEEEVETNFNVKKID